ncbi:hypothetical protein BsWGS_11674 [Bradybaena similaris]
MALVNWIIHIDFAWITLGMVLSVVTQLVVGSCPRDVSTAAHSCFTAYSFHVQNMVNSPQKLCCGVDVETLRAFCQSYTSATTCVSQLKEDCPKDSYQIIDKVSANVDGSRAGLQELCTDDSIIENYAMYQSCFTFAGDGSDMCFQTHMNNSMATTIRFLTKLTTTKMDQFCNDMRHTVDCVQKNVWAMCGDKAAQLAAILVKPMVWQSTSCDYSVINSQGKTTKRAHHGHHAYIANDQSKGQSRNTGHRHSRDRWTNINVFVIQTVIALFTLPILLSC